MRDDLERFERELDQALATYTRAPEIEGLEARVLAAATRPARHRMVPSLQWAAVACVTVIVCGLFWRQAINSPVPQQLAMNAGPVASKIELPIPQRHFTIALAHVASPRRVLNQSMEPKLPQFPAPVPLSGEERALLRLAASFPDFMANEPILGRPIEPIQVKALEIKPLE